MKTIKGTVDFSQDDPTMKISIKEMLYIFKNYPIGDLYKEKKLKNPNMREGEIMREVVLYCYEDLKKNEA